MSTKHWITKHQTTIDRIVTNVGHGGRGSRSSHLAAYQKQADQIGWKVGDVAGVDEIRLRMGQPGCCGYRLARTLLRALGEPLDGTVFHRVR